MIVRNACVVACFALAGCAMPPPVPSLPQSATTIAASAPAVYVEPAARFERRHELQSRGWDKELSRAVVQSLRDGGFAIATTPTDADATVAVSVSRIVTAIIGSNVIQVASRLELQKDGRTIAETTYHARPAEWGSASASEMLPVIAKHLVYPLVEKPEVLAFAKEHSRRQATPEPPRAPPPNARVDIVILKGGTRIRGRITAKSPGEWVTIEENGRSRTLAWDRVDEVIVGGME